MNNPKEGQQLKDVYAATLLEIGKEDPELVVLESDLMMITGTEMFKKAFPERFFNTGSAEANMIGVAAGLSSMGFIPFAATFASFASRRAFDQFFLSANYTGQNVKFVGLDPGITSGHNGGSHVAFEDIVIMRSVPDLVIVDPADAVSLRNVLHQLYTHRGSTYLRLHRKTAEAIYQDDASIELGKGVVLKEGRDVTIIAAGTIMVPAALKAAEALELEGVRPTVIDMHTIKPLDTELILDKAAETGAIVTCENGRRSGGLGSAVAEVITEHTPIPVIRIGIDDFFGEVGSQDYLKRIYKLTSSDIFDAAKGAISKRSSESLFFV